MWRAIKEKREKLRSLRSQKKLLEDDIRSKRALKKEIMLEQVKLRSEIRYIQGRDREW